MPKTWTDEELVIARNHLDNIEAAVRTALKGIDIMKQEMNRMERALQDLLEAD